MGVRAVWIGSQPKELELNHGSEWGQEFKEELGDPSPLLKKMHLPYINFCAFLFQVVSH